MKKQTRTETRIEVHEVLIITEPQTASVLCDVCADPQSAMLAVEEAAALTGISMRAIFRWVEAGQVHYLEQTSGALLICLNSLPGDLDAKPVRALLPEA